MDWIKVEREWVGLDATQCRDEDQRWSSSNVVVTDGGGLAKENRR